MKIKVCGIADPQNMADIIALQIDLIGWIFYPGSPRYIEKTIDRLMEVPRSGVEVAGVFVNADYDEIVRAVDQYTLSTVQLHGNESNDLCHQLGDYATVIKVIHVAHPEDLNQCLEFPDASCLLLETKSTRHGGSGIQFDWNILAEYPATQPFFLSGGIASTDADRLLAIDHPRFAGIDVNSRFEVRPGFKDIELLRPFVTTLKQATAC